MMPSPKSPLPGPRPQEWGSCRKRGSSRTSDELHPFESFLPAETIARVHGGNTLMKPALLAEPVHRSTLG
jgi:hypothetical protein